MRMETKVRVTRLAKYAIAAYVLISLFYTMNHYLSAERMNVSDNSNRKEEIIERMKSLPVNHNPQQAIPVPKVAPAPNRQPSPPKPVENERPTQKPQAPKMDEQEDFDILASEHDQHSSDQVTWPGPKGSDKIHQISENLLRSKIFSSSMGLDNVVPYYHKASNEMKAQDITLATLVTRNRFVVLSRLATNYKGPISAAIHVLDDDEKDETITELDKIYKSNPDMQRYVDVHLIVDKFDRQFNMWRNTAKLFTRTDYLMMLDVDFHLCTDFRKSIFGNPEITRMLETGKTAIVVPAFEYLDQKDGNDWRTFPTTKHGVLDQVNQLKLDSFHSSWVSGHGATNYPRWYNTNEIYPVTEYEFSYEPYVIYKKEGTPWCDERFIGYGANKAACLYEIFISGVDYWVLPNDFLIHQSHKYANHDRTRERVHNKILYENFRTEVCLRYSRKYVTEETWYTPAADNMKKVCTDIPKWKYLSGISKEQRLADLATEQAAAKAAESTEEMDENTKEQMDLNLNEAISDEEEANQDEVNGSLEPKSQRNEKKADDEEEQDDDEGPNKEIFETEESENDTEQDEEPEEEMLEFGEPEEEEEEDQEELISDI